MQDGSTDQALGKQHLHELTVLVPKGEKLAGRKIVGLEAPSGTIPGLDRVENGHHPVRPIVWQRGGVDLHPVNVEAELLVEARPFTESAVDEGSPFGSVLGLHIDLDRCGEGGGRIVDATEYRL